MLTGNLSDLVKMITAGAVPVWLRDYVEQNREKMAYQLLNEGEYVIPCPDGKWLVIRTEERFGPGKDKMGIKAGELRKS